MKKKNVVKEMKAADGRTSADGVAAETANQLVKRRRPDETI